MIPLDISISVFTIVRHPHMSNNVHVTLNLKIWFVSILLVVTLPVGASSEQTDSTLEARDLYVQYFPDMELTNIIWRNIISTDGQLIDELKMATYEVHRSSTMFQPGFDR